VTSSVPFDPAVRAFLDGKEVVTLATVQPDGSPLAMAMWLLPDPDSIVMISVDGLAKVRNLRRDPRVCVLAEAGSRGDARGVAVQGRVEFLADGEIRRRLVERFLKRYDPDLAQYWGGYSMPANRVMFRVVPFRIRSWGLGGS
jgi:PPOX class probable F420-dependent enzyme